MIKAILDTNIVISAALTPKGNSAKIIRLIARDEIIKVYYSADILAEYEEVLSRSHLNISNKVQSDIMNAIKEVGILIDPSVSDIPLPDESDRIFYDAAKESGAILITGNTKHFSSEDFIMTPSQFLDFFKTNLVSDYF